MHGLAAIVIESGGLPSKEVNSEVFFPIRIFWAGLQISVLTVGEIVSCQFIVAD